MLRYLIPVDGSEVANRAVAYVVRMASGLREAPEIHLLNVPHGVPVDVSSVISKEQLDKFHREDGEKALAAGRTALEAAGLAYRHHIIVGEAGPVIVRFAREHAIDQVVMGKHGAGHLAEALLGSVAHKVVHLAEVPVVLVK